MNSIRYKTIARLLIMLMLMTPLTGMAMQWVQQSEQVNHCDDMQMEQQDHMSMLQQHCNMGADCQEICNSSQHCSSTSTSLINSFSSSTFPLVISDLISSEQSSQMSLILSELFRPPRA